MQKGEGNGWSVHARARHSTSRARGGIGRSTRRGTEGPTIITPALFGYREFAGPPRRPPRRARGCRIRPFLAPRRSTAALPMSGGVPLTPSPDQGWNVLLEAGYYWRGLIDFLSDVDEPGSAGVAWRPEGGRRGTSAPHVEVTCSSIQRAGTY